MILFFWREYFLHHKIRAPPHPKGRSCQNQHLSTAHLPPPAMCTSSSSPSQAHSTSYWKNSLCQQTKPPCWSNDNLGKTREIYQNRKIAWSLLHSAQNWPSQKHATTIKHFLLYNSNCEKNIRILFHRILALTQWQKNGTVILPGNRAKWQPVLSES